MTVLLHEASGKLLGHSADVKMTGGHFLNELVYADDTMVIAYSDARAKRYMNCIAEAGVVFGLSLNWEKIVAMPTGCPARIARPGGTLVEQKSSMVYLGGVLDATGSVSSELNRRLGLAQSDFKNLEKVWKHANIPQHRKIQIFDTCVGSQLLYCLHTAWLNKAELRKLDGFHARCLRKIPVAILAQAILAQAILAQGLKGGRG